MTYDSEISGNVYAMSKSKRHRHADAVSISDPAGVAAVVPSQDYSQCGIADRYVSSGDERASSEI